MPRGIPNTVELVQALRLFLEEEVMPGTDGRLNYMARVAVNVASTIERELVIEREHEERHAARLERLGVDNDDELAAAIRRGEFEHRRSDVVNAALVDVAEKLSSWNPRYLEPADRDHLIDTTNLTAPVVPEQSQPGD